MKPSAPRWCKISRNPGSFTLSARYSKMLKHTISRSKRLRWHSSMRLGGSVRSSRVTMLSYGRTTCADEWNLYVDGASERTGGGVRVVLEGPDGFLLELSLIFKFKASNNQAEYEASVADRVGLRHGSPNGNLSNRLATSYETNERRLPGQGRPPP